MPDFIIGGAPRSGTTWLYHLLERHPHIYLAKPVSPEPKFFLVDELYERGLDFYARNWFAAAAPDTVIGEKSTNYLENSSSAVRIHRDVPEVKLVFIFRDPAARAYSNYLWSRKNGLEVEDFATALELEAERDKQVPAKLRYARPHAYFSRGLYAELLQPYLERFSREHILCLKYEDIRNRSTELTAKLHGFLGLEPRPEDGLNLGRINESLPSAEPIPERIRGDLTARYEAPNRRLAELLGPDFCAWTRS